MQIFKLMGSIFIDNKDADKSLQKTESLVGKVGNKFGSGIKTVAKWGAALTGAVAAGGGALLGMANKSAAAMDAIDKGSQRMGVSAKAYQEMEYWASQNGVAHDQMEKAVGRMNQRIGMAKDGNKKYSSALEKLGVDMDGVRNGTVSTEDAFAKSLQTLSTMTNEQDKAALATEMFGSKLARDLLPALGDGSLSFEDAKKKAEELGIVMSDDAVAAGVEFTDTMDSLQRAFGAVVQTVGVEVMPIIQTFLEWILAHMPEIKEIFSVVFGAISVVVQGAVDAFQTFLLPILEAFYTWVSGFLPVIKDIFSSVFDTIKNAVKDMGDSSNGTLHSLKETFSAVLNAIKDLVQVITDAIKKIWEKHGETVKELVKITFRALKEIFEGGMKVIQGVIEVITAIISGDWGKAWEGIKHMTEGILQALKGVFQGGFDAIVLVTSHIMEGIVDAIMKPINWAKEKLFNAIEEMKGFFNFSWSLPDIPLPHFYISGGFSLNPPSVPSFGIDWYKEGGIFDKASIIGVGEAGQEAVLPTHKLDRFLEEAVGRVGGKGNGQPVINLYYQGTSESEREQFKRLWEMIKRELERENRGVLA